MVDTRPRGLGIEPAAQQFGEPSVVNGVLDARPTGSLSLFDVAAASHAYPAQVALQHDDYLPVEHLRVEHLRVEQSVEPGPSTSASIATPSLIATYSPIATPALIASGESARSLSPYPTRAELRRREAADGRKDTSGGRKSLASSLSVPQVGIASALGLATIAAPLTGSLIPPAASASSVSSTLNLSAVAAAQRTGLLGQAPFPLLAGQGANGVEAAGVVADDAPMPSVPVALGAPTKVLVTKVSRSNERAVLPGCDGALPASAADAKNGQLPANELCTIWAHDEKLRTDAAVSLARLNVAYQQAFGKPLCIADAYRSLEEQYAVKAARGYYAAQPGTSEHGWGRAIDLCGGSAVASTPTYTWIRANGPLYGWDNPDWARSTGSGPYEPWHIEYFAGGAGGTSASEQEN